MPDIRFEQKMMIDGKLVDGEAFRCGPPERCVRLRSVHRG